VPIVLGSLWAVIPVIAGSGAYGVRAVLEERLLQRELRGYREYAERVRWRLLPHLW